MTSGWARTQGEGWLYRLVFPDEEEVQEKFTTRQIFRILEDLMSHKASSKDLATETASLVASNPAAWDDVLGIYLSAAEVVADEDALKALVDYIVQLASLPDAFNESHEALIVGHIGYAGSSVRIEPGEPLVLGDGGKRLWRDLPNFSMNITERFQGKLFLLGLYRSFSYTSSKALSNILTTFARQQTLILQERHGGISTLISPSEP
jgi:hypothetical protein